jgi:NADH-quinone oxidoreductase subunit L
MLALCGFPLFFSGFWSKDAILHAASDWSVSRVPFYLATLGVLLTAFYMTRQVVYVFFGRPRLAELSETSIHESPSIMTMPLVILAGFSVLLGLIGTPAWPWFSAFLNAQHARFDLRGFAEPGVLAVMLSSTVLFLIGLSIGWWFYARRLVESPSAPDALEQLTPQVFNLLRHGWFIDNLYAATFVRFVAWCSRACAWLDKWVFGGVVRLVSWLVVGVSRLNRSVDVFVVNRGFDQSCLEVSRGGRLLSRLQSGRTQSYLRAIGIAFAALVLFLIWGRRG